MAQNAVNEGDGQETPWTKTARAMRERLRWPDKPRLHKRFRS
jgi:hypothetical protein